MVVGANFTGQFLALLPQNFTASKGTQINKTTKKKTCVWKGENGN